MKKLKILLDKYILNKTEKINPHLYRFLTYNLYKVYSEIVNSIKYKDKYFFHSVSLEDIRNSFNIDNAFTKAFIDYLIQIKMQKNSQYT